MFVEGNRGFSEASEDDAVHVAGARRGCSRRDRPDRGRQHDRQCGVVRPQGDVLRAADRWGCLGRQARPQRELTIRPLVLVQGHPSGWL